ncbi:MAG: hypothetical protein E5Y61_16780, partial [Mesorhizobium sp.]
MVIGGKILCLALAPPSCHFNDAALHRFLTRLPEDGPELEERNIGRTAYRKSAMQEFLIPAKPDLQAARESWLKMLARERR